jgi:hypothetical protein
VKQKNVKASESDRSATCVSQPPRVTLLRSVELLRARSAVIDKVDGSGGWGTAARVGHPQRGEMIIEPCIVFDDYELANAKHMWRRKASDPLKR